jgi:hypothetical protein
MINTKETDYLEQDPEIRGQNYVCISFVSPEEILKQKETYFLEVFMEHISIKVNELIDNIEKLYPDKSDDIRAFKELYEPIFKPDSIHSNFRNFITQNNQKLEKQFHEANNFQTSIRGIKVRGVYDSLKEAEHRSKSLQQSENNKFSIYIAQVGCWCPWSPHPDNIENQEFAETSLNTLMHKYAENVESSQQHFIDRKNELRTRLDSNENDKKKNIPEDLSEDISDLTIDSKGKGKMYTDDDPWLTAKHKD